MRTLLRRPVRRLAAPLAVLWAALALVSCAKKNVILPVDGVEGVPSPSQLVVYPDLPVKVYVFDDVGQPNCSDDDTLVSVVDSYVAGGPGAVRGIIFDYTAADRFEAFRHDGASFQPLQDYLLQPFRRYVEGQTDVFTFRDDNPHPALARYLGRGVAGGVVTPQSPKTNVASTGTPIVSTLRYALTTNVCGDPPGSQPRPDSLLHFRWDPIANAVGYWVHIFQFDRGANFRASAYPSPVHLGRTLDHFLAWFPAGVTEHRLGQPPPPGVKVLASRGLLNNTDYVVRITAVNAEGQMVAYAGSTSRAFFVRQFADPPTYYEVMPVGAFVVHTGLTVPCPATFSSCKAPIGSAIPGVRIYHPDALPAALR